MKINYDDVLVRMGANKYLTKIDDKMKGLILETISLAEKILQPKYAVSFAKKNIVGDVIYLDDFAILSKDIFKLLDGYDTVCGLVATVGLPIDTKIADLLEKKDILQAFVLDSIGSVAVEDVVESICNDVKQKYGETTFRFSPGYGDWGLKNQPAFLHWLGAEKTGVILSSSYQMIPRKSVSALLGVRNSLK
ncbi:MAG: hypothetical protein II816_03535 [Elusimicrobia bacterium]|nr:hypothetical protein [Elusimicrobiota bacterium]